MNLKLSGLSMLLSPGLLIPGHTVLGTSDPILDGSCWPSDWCLPYSDFYQSPPCFYIGKHYLTLIERFKFKKEAIFPDIQMM
jgi:hypothetical protein